MCHVKVHDVEYAARGLRSSALLSEDRSMFLEDLRSLSKLKCPTIVACAGISVSKDGLFVVVELMPGELRITVDSRDSQCMLCILSSLASPYMLK